MHATACVCVCVCIRKKFVTQQMYKNRYDDNGWLIKIDERWIGVLLKIKSTKECRVLIS